MIDTAREMCYTDIVFSFAIETKERYFYIN